ncbi:MAG: hypothetical protein E7620_06425 [Ruminococcaceae bacterium]|nr:hypothetical protein [Oscillospiraceae bacterium]
MKFKALIALVLLCAAVFTGCGNHGQGSNHTGDSSDSIPPAVSGSVEDPTEEESLPSEPIMEEEGVIRSKESETLTFFAKWSAVSYNGKKATVTVKVGITCYSISTGKHKGSVTVNGETKTFSTRAIESTTHEKKKFDFAELTFTVDLDEDGLSLMEIDAEWEFEDTEGGSFIESFTASAIIKLPGGEIYVPDTSEEDSQEQSPMEAIFVGDEEENGIPS